MSGASGGTSGISAIKRVTVLCAVAFALLAMTSARAQAVMTTSPPTPVAGDTVTAHGFARECGNNAAPTLTVTFTLHHSDGTSTTAASGLGTFNNPIQDLEYSAALSQAGAYTATEDAYCPTNNDHVFDHVDFTVGAGLGGTITVSPDPPVVSQQASLNVSPAGGNPGYSYTWDLNDDGAFGDATTHNTNYTFTTVGSHTVRVRITDTGGGGTGNPSHTATVTKAVDVVAPSSNPPPPPPPPKPCVSTVAFKLSEFKTAGCFTQTSSSPDTWTTTSAVTLNGIMLPDFGQTFTITGPTPSEPGGHFTAPSSTMQLDGFNAFSGNIDWSLPDGGPGQEKVIPGQSFAVASGAALLGLNVRGSIALELGEDADGTHYADFPLTVELPVSFTAGPDPAFGRVTGNLSLRVDDGGVHYNGLKLQAKDVWLGKLKVHSVCFSYIPAGGLSTTPCDPPSFGGDPGLITKPGGEQPFIQCGSDPATDRWDASAEIQVPSGLQLGAFGGLANGNVSKLGASIDNLGRRVPLAYGLYLDHVSFGLCLSPPPFKIRANVGANFLGASNLVNIDGGFTYTDAVGFTPWSLQLDGAVSIGQQPNALPLGSGTLGINGASVITFGLKAGIDVLDGTASLNAQVSGWIDAPHNQFVVSGSGQGCFAGVCAKAAGELSSTGVAGCVTVGTSTPTYDLIIPLDGSAPHLDTRTHSLTAGFGYVWGASSVDLLGGSCNFSAYEPTRPAGARAAAAGSRLRLRVAHGTDAVGLRIHGTHGPPKVVVRGPGGTTIVSPSGARGKLRKGHYLLVENKSDGTTNVMLVHPAAGTWTVSPAPGTASSPTKIDRANVEVPPTFGARVLGKGASRTVQVAYAVPVGTSVQLIERAKGVNHTIVKRLRGRRCAGLPRLRPGTDEKILCARIRFRPASGPGTTRNVQAVVTRGGIPLVQTNIASFRVPRPALPSRVPALRATRGNGSLVIAFSPSTGASRYSVAAKLSDGRELALDVGGRCRTVLIANVPADVAAEVKVAGVRFDLAMGRSRSISIKANAASAGRVGKKFRPGKVCT